MWPFNHQDPLDTNTEIYLDDTGTRFLPLTYENAEEFDRYVKLIQDKLRQWIALDMTMVTHLAREASSSLAARFATLDLKQLPFDGTRVQLLSYIAGDDAYRPFPRFLDVVNEITLEIPVAMTECLKGKFLYTMLYVCPQEVGARPMPTVAMAPDPEAESDSEPEPPIYQMPTKQQWLDLLADHPWVYLITFVQALYDYDVFVSDIVSAQAKARAEQATRANNPDRPIA